MMSGTGRDDRATGPIAVLSPEVGATAERHHSGLAERFAPPVPRAGRADIDQRAAAGDERGREPGRQLPRRTRPAQAYGSPDAIPAGIIEIGAAKLRRASSTGGEHGASFDGIRAAVDPEHRIAPGGQRERDTARPGGEHEHAITRRKPQLALDDADLMLGLTLADNTVPEATEKVGECLPVAIGNLAGRLVGIVADQTRALGMITPIMEPNAFPARVSAV